MTVWLDAHLSPALASWVTATFGLPCEPVRTLGLRESDDEAIFDSARSTNVIVMTKDADFVDLVERLGPPPHVLWLRCGNTTNAALRKLLTHELPNALTRIRTGEPFVELGSDEI